MSDSFLKENFIAMCTTTWLVATIEQRTIYNNYNYYYVKRFLPTCRQGASADNLQSKGCHKSSPLFDSPGLKQGPMKLGHGAQYVYFPP
jgi:hypothetical protein